MPDLVRASAWLQVLFSVVNTGPDLHPPYTLSVQSPNYTDVSLGVRPPTPCAHSNTSAHKSDPAVEVDCWPGQLLCSQHRRLIWASS